VLGKHLLADMYGVDSRLMTDERFLKDLLVRAAVVSGLHLIAEPCLIRFPADLGSTPRVRGGGVTGFALLSESHISFHSYPERNFLALDIFTCGKADPHRALQIFQEALSPREIRVISHNRGAALAG